jgi:DNA-binding NarL/FixJ family response regulator
VSAHDDAQVALLQAQIAEAEALAFRLLREAQDAQRALSTLSPQQMLVAQYTAKGFRKTEIGRLIGLSQNTVAEHMRKACTKLQINTNLELAVIVAKAGLS